VRLKLVELELLLSFSSSMTKIPDVVLLLVIASLLEIEIEFVFELKPFKLT
jgi:hypothetical protein